MTAPRMRRRTNPQILRLVAADLIKIHDTTVDALPTPLRTRLLGHAITIDSMATHLEQQDTE